MKIAIRTVFSLLVVGALTFAGCNKYDDSVLTGRVDDLENRVTELEKLVNDLNTNVKSLSTLVMAMEQENRITEIKPLDDGSGYEITFTKLGKMIIKNGEKPSIGVTLDETDGIYYWTVDGQPMLDGENKIPATIAPEFKAEAGKLYFRINGGEWTLVEGAEKGIGLISGIKQTDENVTFTLADGQEIVIPKVQGFGLKIDFSEFGAEAGATISVPYIIVDGDAETVVKAIPDPGYAAVVNGSNIDITLPEIDPYKGQVVVVAINGKGEMSGKLLSFADKHFVVANAGKMAKIGKNGGVVTMNIEANMPYTYILDPKYTWISEVPATKAARKDAISFNVQASPDGAERTAVINIMYGYEYENKATFTIIQTSGGEADFSTFNGVSKNFMTLADESITTDSGWHFKNCVVLNKTSLKLWDAVSDKDIVPFLCGVVHTPGELYSPEIEGGCGTLKVRFGTHQAKSIAGVGYGFTIIVTNGTETKTFEEKSDTGSQYTVYEKEYTVNLTGKFTITFKNSCIHNNTNTRQLLKDGIGLLSVEWTANSGQ